MKDALLALGARALFLLHGTLAVWKCQSTYNTAFMYILLGKFWQIILQCVSKYKSCFWDDFLNQMSAYALPYRYVSPHQ